VYHTIVKRLIMQRGESVYCIHCAESQWIVTEYGARNLCGMTLRERAQALIEIAHPEFREALIWAARERRLLT